MLCSWENKIGTRFQETLYLLSIPGMRESSVEGLSTCVDQCSNEPGW